MQVMMNDFCLDGCQQPGRASSFGVRYADGIPVIGEKDLACVIDRENLEAKEEREKGRSLSIMTRGEKQEVSRLLAEGRPSALFAFWHGTQTLNNDCGCFEVARVTVSK